MCALEGDGALDSEEHPTTLRYIASGGEKMSDSVRRVTCCHVFSCSHLDPRFSNVGRTTLA